MFPIDYDDSFFEHAVSGTNGILSWAAIRYVPSRDCARVGYGWACTK